MIKIAELIKKCDLSVYSGDNFDEEVKNVYIGDLLSDVMGNAKEDSVWLTVQSHINIIAVANITSTKVIILCNGLNYEKGTKEKAELNNVVLLKSNQNSFETVKKIIELGL